MVRTELMGGDTIYECPNCFGTPLVGEPWQTRDDRMLASGVKRF